jgi:hypothetical protein
MFHCHSYPSELDKGTLTETIVLYMHELLLWLVMATWPLLLLLPLLLMSSSRQEPVGNPVVGRSSFEQMCRA